MKSMKTYVKPPLPPQTAALLKAANIRVSMTGLAVGHQVLPCMQAGAEYATPYLGRMNERLGRERVGDAGISHPRPSPSSSPHPLIFRIRTAQAQV